ncbi:MAG: RNA 2',3'-cyclic phosphodiesterase [Ilumatobacteraceae bacterium]
MARLFVALRLPPDIARRLETIPRPSQDGVHYTSPENWHITLRFLGEENPTRVAQALSGLQSRSLRVKLGPVLSPLGVRVVVVPAAGLEGLAAEIAKLTADLGSHPVGERFIGHVTLARVRRGCESPAAIGMPFDAEFDVTEVELVESHFDDGGVRYETVGAWRIGEGDALEDCVTAPH